MRPDELRLFATQWRNLAGAAQRLNEYVRGTGQQGCELLHGQTSEQHAQAAAQRLEDLADELERKDGAT